MLPACSFVKEGSSISATTSGEADTDTEATTTADTGSTDASTGTDETTSSATSDSTDATTEMTSDATASTSEVTPDASSDPTTTNDTSTDTDCACGAPGELWPGVVCTDECTYDFSGAPQWYCTGMCSPVDDGAPVGLPGCDDDDATLFCRFLTGNPDAVAASWEQAAALPTAGFCCPTVPGTESLGPFPAFGVTSICYTGDDLAATHGPGFVILASEVTCEG